MRARQRISHFPPAPRPGATAASGRRTVGWAWSVAPPEPASGKCPWHPPAARRKVVASGRGKQGAASGWAAAAAASGTAWRVASEALGRGTAQLVNAPTNRPTLASGSTTMAFSRPRPRTCRDPHSTAHQRGGTAVGSCTKSAPGRLGSCALQPGAGLRFPRLRRSTHAWQVQPVANRHLANQSACWMSGEPRPGPCMCTAIQTSTCTATQQSAASQARTCWMSGEPRSIMCWRKSGPSRAAFSAHFSSISTCVAGGGEWRLDFCWENRRGCREHGA